MLLPFHEGLMPTTHFDSEMANLADKHYSRRTIGARQFMYAGRKLVLRNWEGTILFGWIYAKPEMRLDGIDGFNCVIFRNESARRSSDIILEAEEHAQTKWGPNRCFTYVDPKKIKSRNPGYCFKVAGWRFIRESKGGLHLLIKENGSGHVSPGLRRVQ